VSRKVQVTRTYLELKTPGQLNPFKVDDPLLRFARVPVPSVPLAQRLYQEVGAPYHWIDRWQWSSEEWQAYVGEFGYGIWILTSDGDLAGFVEMKNDADGSVEISLLGLVLKHQGRGLGKHLLTHAVETAWGIGANRVWLHTCTLDGPAALPNYLARGFEPYKTETYEAALEETAPGNR
jgi:GNAT superfamily N-acetyltransferase